MRTDVKPWRIGTGAWEALTTRVLTVATLGAATRGIAILDVTLLAGATLGLAILEVVTLAFAAL
jgi:hypothetical protein